MTKGPIWYKKPKDTFQKSFVLFFCLLFVVIICAMQLGAASPARDLKEDCGGQRCTDKSCLCQGGSNLAASDADNILNSRTEYHQPSLQRITLTREPRGAGS